MKDSRVQVVGPVCFDLVFSGLSSPPLPGTEVRASDLGVSPGGTANVAIALARLGLDVALSAVFSEDPFGRYLWSSLSDEGVDLTYSVEVGGWSTPVTSSVAVGVERSMVSYVEAPPLAVAELLPAGYRADALVISLGEVEAGWLPALHRIAPLVFADVAWDDDRLGSSELLGRLAAVDVFLPNAAEALAATNCTTLFDAATNLSRRGPLVVVKNGGTGSAAMCPGSDSLTEEPALAVDARDTTGAGDVFDAGFVYGSLAGWPMAWRLRFANLCASESVKLMGGSLAAPCWRDLAAAYRAMPAGELRTSYRFLETVLSDAPTRRDCRRSMPSLAPPLAPPFGLGVPGDAGVLGAAAAPGEAGVPGARKGTGTGPKA
ncbi:MAG: carbohydrate kinase family protein [Acidimicrobiales bacterium]